MLDKAVPTKLPLLLRVKIVITIKITEYHSLCDEVFVMSFPLFLFLYTICWLIYIDISLGFSCTPCASSPSCCKVKFFLQLYIERFSTFSRDCMSAKIWRNRNFFIVTNQQNFLNSLYSVVSRIFYCLYSLYNLVVYCNMTLCSFLVNNLF